jgi:hypothetical protein
MPSSRRRPGLLVLALVAVAACGSAASSGSSAATEPTATIGASGSPEVTTLPSSSTTVSQTDTAWGRIWDTVPTGFPRFPGWSPADDASADPASARYAVSGSDPEEIAGWLQAGMETATFSTDVSGPLEDGSFTLESVGDGGCRIHTTVAPLGGMTFVTVLYGADCPIQ